MEMKSKPAVARLLRGPFAGIVVATGLALGLLTSAAEARDFFGDPFRSRGYYPFSRSYFNSARPPGRVYDDYGYGGPRVDRLKAQTAEKLKQTPAPPPTKGPLLVVVSLAKQQLTVYDEGVPFLHSKVSTGSRGHETPTGVFAVIQKARWHRSNLYSDAPMPFMQRITWSGVALHAGLLPGYPASHGCIRMPEDFAVRMWRTTQTGVRVIVVQNDVAPAEIAHPLLFVKKVAPPVMPPVASSSLNLRSSAGLAKADATAAPFAPPAPAAADKADPAQIKVAEIAVVRAGQAPGTAGIATDQSALKPDSKAVSTSTPRELPVAREAPLAAAPQPSAPSSLAQAAPPLVTPPANALTPSLPSPAMPSLVPERTLRPGPVSVFVSRKERKLFVRKGFEPLFEAAVTIKDADQPLGTHVFTALAQEASNDTFRWNVVTVPNTVRTDRRAETAEPPVRYAARKKPADKEIVVDALPPPSTDAAKAALDRIEMPADAVQRVSELMAVGASLIITDEGLGPETGLETDFVVLTRDGAQPPPPAKKPRRRSYDFD